MILAVATREVFWQMSRSAEAFWYVLVVVSVAVFLFGAARPIAKYRRGRRNTLPPRGELRARLRRAIEIVATQATIRRRDKLAGRAHTAIFYGFIVLLIGTIILGVQTDFTEPLFGWRFFHGAFYLGYSVILDIFGVGLVVSVVLMMFRRGVTRPAKLDYHRPDRAPTDEAQKRTMYRVGDWVFLSALLYLTVTGYLLEGVRIAMDQPGYNGFSPVGWLVSEPISALGLSSATLGDTRHVMWWSHGVVALIFVASIPYTKAVHMLTSFASIVLRDPDAGRRLRPIPAALEAEPAGYGELSDFSVEHLLQLDACTKCGKCHEVCPALASGLPLSPRDVILSLREQANDQLYAGLFASSSERFGATTVIGETGVSTETIWSCMQCNACVEVCPVSIEQAPIINQLRRRLVEEGKVEAPLQKALLAVQKSGNSFGENRRERGRWTTELDFEVKDARTQPVDVLWFVGDYASFDPRSQMITRVIAGLMHAAGVDFGILYDGEGNSGNDVRRVGEEGLFEELAERNVETINACSFNRIITSDPHSLNTLANEYPAVGGGWDVQHHSRFLAGLIAGGKIPIVRRLGYRVTYHDPCYLGRLNGGFDAPRQILEAVGCELVEMPRNRENSFCCGAGGGRIWMNGPKEVERPSEGRIREALDLGALDYFVVSCPKDVTMYEDAIKTTGSSDRLALKELAELIAEAACPV